MIASIVRKPFRGGPLTMIAAFMLVSAALRLGSEAGAVLAREAGQGAGDETAAQKSDPAPSATGNAAALLAALQRREAVLRSREQALEDRMKALQVAGRAIDARLTEMAESEARLKETLTVVDGASARDIAKLIEVYEQMKPKETARVFEQMAPDFAAGFLGRMRSEIAAEVLAGMKPEAAYSVSVIMAGRNVGVPTQ